MGGALFTTADGEPLTLSRTMHTFEMQQPARLQTVMQLMFRIMSEDMTNSSITLTTPIQVVML
jgi:hypothetical protein